MNQVLRMQGKRGSLSPPADLDAPEAHASLSFELAELRLQLANASAANHVLSAVNEASTERSAYLAALESVLASWGWEYGAYWLRDGEELVFGGDAGRVGDAFQDATRKLSFTQGSGLVGACWAKRELLSIEDLPNLPGFRRAVAARASNLNAALCFPILDEDEVVGALDFYASSLTLSDSRLSALRSIAQIVSASIARLRGAERERKRAAELQRKVDVLLETVDAAASGDLTRPVTVLGDDAIGRLGAGLQLLLTDLRKNLGAIAQNSQTLAAASEEMSAISQQLNSNADHVSSQASLVSSGSDQMSQSIHTIAAGSEEMTASIGEIAKNAGDAASVATSGWPRSVQAVGKSGRHKRRKP